MTAARRRNDFKNDLTGGYLGGGFVQSMFLPSDGNEWFLAPTMKKIEWGRIESVRKGKTVAITDPVLDVPNPAIDRESGCPASTTTSPGPPDIGAYETGRPPLRFDARRPRIQRAPWDANALSY